MLLVILERAEREWDRRLDYQGYIEVAFFRMYLGVSRGDI